MPEDELVVSNTSPLLTLALGDRLELLEAQFGSVTVPEHVWRELTDGEEGVPELEALRERDFLTVVSIENDDLYVELKRDLDEGEAATLTYAIENEADLVLLDERDARKTARRHGLAITGAIGVLLRAADRGSVDIRAELTALREAGFWISDELSDEIIERSGEDG